MSFCEDQQPLILSAVRTPIGSLQGSLSSIQAHELGAICIKKAVELSGVKVDQVSEVIFGQVLTAGQGQNPVRQAAINAGLPNTVPATTVSMVCGSGLRSVIMAAQAIKLGDSEVVVAGGQESMSLSHHSIFLRNGTKMGNASLADTMIVDGLTDAFKNIHMGITAENIATKYNISREEQDEFAFNSQRKAGIALKNDVFKEEIIPVVVSGRKGSVVVDKDEFPKPDTTLDGLKKLRAAFIKDGSGTVTAGNASGINDGAAAIVVSSQKFAKSAGIRPIAKIVAYASCGVDPSFMGIGPVTAVQSALKRAGWNIEEVDLYELNEAFASQSIAVIKELGVNPAKVNVHGGAIALGHPIGASGGRILVTLLHALKRTGGKKGVAALCIGGGMGIALCVQLL